MTSSALQLARRELGSAIAAAWNFMSGRLPDGLTFSRASGGTVFAPARYADNSVVNGDFANGLTGWSVLTGCTIANVGSALQITATATNGGATSADFAGGANKMFRTSIRNTGATAVTFYVRDAAGTVDFVAVTVPAGATFSTTILCTVATLNVRVFCIGAAGTVALVDDVVVQELTIWRPGMDWLGPELAAPISGWAPSNGATIAGNVATLNKTSGIEPQISLAIPTALGRVFRIVYGGQGFGGTGNSTLYTPSPGYVAATAELVGRFTLSQTYVASAAITAVAIAMGGGGGALGMATVDVASVREQLYTWMQVLVPAGVPRFQYDPLTYAPLGLLVEPQRTNLFLFSENFTGTGWTSGGNGTTVTAAAGTAPDGALSASLLTASAAGTCTRAFNVPIGNVAVATSFFLKAGSATQAVVGMTDLTSGDAAVTVNLLNGANLNTTAIGSWTTLSARIVALPNGWYRVSMTATKGAGTSVAGYVSISSGAGTTVLVWGGQLEAGTEPTSYIPTNGAAAARAADDSPVWAPERPKDDFRPESRHVNEVSIRVAQPGSVLDDQQKVELWARHVRPSMADLKSRNLADHTSLGIVRPDDGSIKFRHKRLEEASQEDRELREAFHQVSLIEGEGKLPALPVEFDFSYRFTCNGNRHDMKIHDWEVQAAYFNFKSRYGASALDHLTAVYQNHIPSRNLHFVMGTMKAHPRQFIIIGLLRSGISPIEVSRQGSLL